MLSFALESLSISIDPPILLNPYEGVNLSHAPS